MVHLPVPKLVRTGVKMVHGTYYSHTEMVDMGLSDGFAKLRALYRGHGLWV